MTVHRSMVSLEEAGKAADRHGPDKDAFQLAGVFEEGMKAVLRQIARFQVKYEYEHAGVEYQKSEDQYHKIDELFNKLQDEVPEELKAKVIELQSQIGFLSVLSLDDGYTAGFLAGYRFLKELDPE